ncbi:MAG: zinc ribbon domain-containing protein [Oscillospiraceae bacterium]|nr:zinc ribbon domain-containing protein [Oscillospiraceae bacterium]
MKCPKCGAEVAAGSRFCTSCGQSMAASQPAPAPAAAQPAPAPVSAPAAAQQPVRQYAAPQQQYAQPQQQYAQPQYNIYNNMSVTEANLPAQYKPLSPWAYFGLSLLFAVPIVGLVFLIVFSFNNNNINRRNFARSFFCMLLIAAIIFVIVLVISLILGNSILDSIRSSLRYYSYW